MPKPTEVPRWATTGERVEPTEGKKDAGFLAEERPPAQILNWLLGLTAEWAEYLDGLDAEALTWTGTHIFNGPVQVNGAAGMNEPALQTVDASLTPDAFGVKLIWRAELEAGRFVRLYVTSAWGLVLTFNARLTAHNMVAADALGVDCVITCLGKQGLVTQSLTAADLNPFSWSPHPAGVRANGVLSVYGQNKAGTPGDVTVDDTRTGGKVAIAAGASSVTVTCPACWTSAVVVAVISAAAADATLTRIERVVPGSGTFTIYGNAAATGNVEVSWFMVGASST